MNKENIRRRIRNVTAFAAALLLAASFSLPSGTEIMGERVGNAIVASAWEINNEDFEYEVNSDGETVTITGYSGGDSSVTIPDDIKGNTVTAIGDVAFDNCTNLESITIPNSVTSIGIYAFHGCSNLTSVLFEDNSQLTSIGDTAFADCWSLTSITIPAGVTSIEAATFNGCRNLKSITIPSDVTSIGNFAFANCESLKTITIPSDVTSIGDCAFVDCTSLTSIFLPDGATVNDGAIPASATQIKYTVNRSGKISITGIALGTDRTSVDIPEAISGKTVTSIGEFAFEGTNLTSVSFADNSQLTFIGNGAFSNCTNLESITIPNSVTYIGSSAFQVCSNLTSVLFEDNSQLTYIGGTAFADCESLTSITIPARVTSIETNTFNGCRNLESITIPSDVTSIGGFAFADCESLKTITIPSDVTSIGECAFLNCDSLESIFLPNDLDVSSARIPSSATQIKYSVIDNSNVIITKVTPGEGVTSVTVPETIDGKMVCYVENSAFEDCSSLESIFLPCGVDSSNGGIPASATQIKYSVGEDGNVTITNVTPGEGVTSVTVPDTIDGKKVTAVGNDAFYQRSELTSIDLPDGLTSIGEYAFYECSGLTSIILPDGVTSIGSSAFESCDSLTSITIPKSVTSIGRSAFFYCSSLSEISVDVDNTVYSSEDGILFDKDKTKLISAPINKKLESYTIPSSVTSIEYKAFLGCQIKNIIIPYGVTSIGGSAFMVSGIESISIPESVASIGAYAFNSCEQLTDIVLPNGIKNIDDNTFSYCSKLKNVVIPESVTSLGASCFSGCNKLESITIPNGVISIGNEAFYDCRSLKSIIIPSNVNFIGEGAFSRCEGLEIILYPDSLDVLSANIPQKAAQIKYTAENDNITIMSVTLGEGQTSLTIPDTIGGKTVAFITDNALAGCTSLESIFIPNTVDITNAGIPTSAAQIKYTVGNDGNVTITAVTLGGDASGFVLPEMIGGRAVTGFADGALADCPDVEHEHKCEIHGMCTICGDGAEVCGDKAHYVFDNNTGTLTIFGEGSVTKNNWYETTFIDSTKKIVIESGITDFDYISNFMEVESISYPDTITKINFENISSHNENLTSITIDEGNKNYCAVDNVVFSKDKTKLYYYLRNNPASEYVIPAGVTSIEASAFESCINLKNITIPSGVQNIGSGAFQCCNSLESITLPSSVTTVGWFAFYYCENLETIFIPHGKDVSEAGISYTTTKVVYSADDDDNVSITSITLGTEKTSVNIPVTIDGNKVISVAKECQQYVGEHTHVGGEATCASKAVCELCGGEYGEMKAHSLKKHDAVSVSCTTDGSIEYYECSECGKLFTDSTGETETTLDKVKITSTGHKFGTAWKSNPEGHYHVCTVCNEQSASEAHTKDDGTVTKEATPTEIGTITYKCKVCGELMGQSIITATISSFEVTENGVVVKYTVTGCTAVKSKTYTFSEVTVEWVEMMKKENIKLVIDFVNYSTAADRSEPVILTAAQMKAIEYVLENDLK